MSDPSITPDEIIVTCMARQVVDGEMVVQGLATPLATAAYLLARQTHAPHLYFASAIGQGVCQQPARLSVLHVERLWLDNALTTANFVRAVADILPSLRPKEFFRPAQVDPNGNFNNIAFGKDYRRPRLRLPGTGGIPDVTTYISDILLYVPRHSRLTFVPKLDFMSGLGHHPNRRLGQGPVYLVSDMGQFDFTSGRMRLLTYHPGFSVEKIQARTGFELQVAPQVGPTPLPTQAELSLLREVVDPLGIRRLELLSGSERRARLTEIIKLEQLG